MLFRHGEVPAPASAAAMLTASLAVVAALWWGQSFLVPVCAGLILAVTVMPLARRLQRLLRSDVLAGALCLSAVLGVLGVCALAFGAQLLRVADRVPEMISMVSQHITAAEPGGGALMKRARASLLELDVATDRLVADKPTGRAARRVAAVATPGNSISEAATEALRDSAISGSGALFGFGGTLTIIFFVAFFVLAGGQTLCDHFVALLSPGNEGADGAQRTCSECARQIRLYAGVLLATNSGIGVIVWLAFRWAELPDAAGWGVTAALLHVVPYLGMALLTALGAAETFLVHETVGSALAMAAFIVLLSTLVGTFVTAWLQSRAAKMNPAALFIGLLFWGALWGVWGLFLGPLLVVMFKVLVEQTPGGARWSALMKG